MPVINGGYCTRITSQAEGLKLKKLLLNTYKYLKTEQIIVRPLLNNEKVIFGRDFSSKNPKNLKFTTCEWGIIYPGNKDLFAQMQIPLLKAEKSLGALTAKGLITTLAEGDVNDAMNLVTRYYPKSTKKNKLEIEKTLKKLGKLVHE